MNRVRQNLGHVFCVLSFPSLAAFFYEWAWRHGDTSLQNALTIAEMRYASSDIPRAGAWFRAALQVAPHSLEARGGIALALYAQGRKRDAAAELWILARMEERPEILALLAEVRKQTGDTIGSIEAFRRAAELPLSAEPFVLGERMLGEEMWHAIISSLNALRGTRPAVGVGTHLIRNRQGVLERVFSRRRAA